MKTGCQLGIDIQINDVRTSKDEATAKVHISVTDKGMPIFALDINFISDNPNIPIKEIREKSAIGFLQTLEDVITETKNQFQLEKVI